MGDFYQEFLNVTVFLLSCNVNHGGNALQGTFYWLFIFKLNVLFYFKYF